MDPLESFLRPLFSTGVVRLEQAPQGDETPSPEALGLFRKAFQNESIDLAGPRLPFQEKVASAAARLVHQACWALVDRRGPAESLAAKLRLVCAKRGPEHHLSADITLRFLATVHRRARALDRDDPLAQIVADVLRAWPLSGVLADLVEGPTETVDLGGHPGVWMLYAERLARRDRADWRPQGPALEIVELVLGKAGTLGPRPRVGAVGVNHGE